MFPKGLPMPSFPPKLEIITIGNFVFTSFLKYIKLVKTLETLTARTNLLIKCAMLIRSVMSNSLRPHGQ